MVQLKRIVFSWILAYAVIGLLLPLTGLVSRPWIQLTLVIYLMAFIAALGLYFLQSDIRAGSQRAIGHVNLSVGWIMLMIIIDRITSTTP